MNKGSRLDRAVIASMAMLWMALAARGDAAMGFGKKSDTFTPSGQWEPYFVDNKGGMSPLLQPLERNSDKDWKFLRFTEYPGPKIRVAVMMVENRTATAASAKDSGAVVVTDKAAEVNVANIEEILTSAVASTHRFQIVDRKDIEKTLQEQDLGGSGRAQKDTVAKTGQIVGAEYLIYATVNDYTPVKSHTGTSAGKGAAGLFGVSKNVSEVTLSLRVVDVASSANIFNATERATAENWDVNLAGISGNGSGGGISSQQASPIGYAVQSCINKVVYRLVMKLKDRPWTGSVIKVAGQQVYVDAGSASGLSPGVELVARSQGAEVRGLNGESLGAESSRIGTLRVINVQEKFSIAEVIEGCQGLKVGDRVELRDTAALAPAVAR